MTRGGTPARNDSHGGTAAPTPGGGSTTRPVRPGRRAALVLLPLLLLGSACEPGARFLGFGFAEPVRGVLSVGDGSSPFRVELDLPEFGTVQELELRLNGTRVLRSSDGGLVLHPFTAEGSLDLPPGRHQFEARALVDVLGVFQLKLSAWTWVDRIELDRPDVCEFLNDVECVLPYPSSRFLEPAATATGVRVSFPPGALPGLPLPLDSARWSGQDGFSPGTQVLMHFPGGVDPVLSDAPRLRPDTRTLDERSLQPDSPTLLLDATEGYTPVLHWIERDARAPTSPMPEREVLFLRPAATLKGGHRYVVAMRNLVHPDGTPVEAEPVFAAIRDGRPTDHPAVEARRAELDALLDELDGRGVERSELVLAFDFVVQSDEELTRAMLAMRDRAFEWLAEQEEPTFTVFPFVPPGSDSGDVSVERDCDVPGTRIWREVRGRFQVPLFLSSDPLANPVAGGKLVDEDGDGRPEQQGILEAPYAITIPCAARDAEEPLRAILTGHGLFGNGRSVVNVPNTFGAAEIANGGDDFLRISGATDWLGLSSHDFSAGNPINSFIAQSVLLQPDEFQNLPDRLRQGMTNALVLARMMREGRFNAHPAFQDDEGRGVFAEPADSIDYFGISLGGIMGTFFSALSPDVEGISLDVPAANFSILVQRSTAIALIDFALNLLNPDRMVQAIFFSLAEEQWDSAEPVGYLRHVTRDPLPGSGEPKDLLYTVAEHDGVVSNIASEVAIRSLGLPNLHDTQTDEGSSVSGLVDIPDVPGPLAPGDPDFVGATIWSDAGMYGDLSDPELAAFAPPLDNGSVASSCDPHGRTLQTPAVVRQITTWLDERVIDHFCDGECDALATGGGFYPFEIPGGAAEPCDPR